MADAEFPSFWQAKHDFQGNPQGRQLSFKKGESFLILEKHEGGWFTAERNRERGYVPSNFLFKIDTPTKNTEEEKVVDDAAESIEKEKALHGTEATVEEDKQSIRSNSTPSFLSQPQIKRPGLNRLPPPKPANEAPLRRTLSPLGIQKQKVEEKPQKVLSNPNLCSKSRPALSRPTMKPPVPNSNINASEEPSNIQKDMENQKNTIETTAKEEKDTEVEAEAEVEVEEVESQSLPPPSLPNTKPVLFVPNQSNAPKIPLRMDLGEEEPKAEPKSMGFFDCTLLTAENIFMKYGKKGKAKRCIFYVDPTLTKLCWKEVDKDKIEGFVLIEEVISTKKGHLSKKLVKTANLAIALSILCYDESKTLELDAENPQLRNEWFINFQLLLNQHALGRLKK